jgi:hypothetical protein
MAMKWEDLLKNPFAGVKLLRVRDIKERILKPGEEVQLLTACDKIRAPHLKSLITVA